MSNSIENKKLISASRVVDNKKVLIEVDTTTVTFENLKTIDPSDKGNRTVLYEKWVEGGITYQLTGYVTSTNYEALENQHKTQEMARQAKENQELKAQLAQFQTLMSNPEFKAIMSRFTK
jgi:hypothetical protein